MLTRDFHIHTKYCHHAQGEMEEYVQSAIAKGLTEICFLEHYEADIQYHRQNWPDAAELQIYYQAGIELQQKYQTKIEINLGIELGLNLAQIEELQRGLQLYPWDYIGLSFHYLKFEPMDINICSSNPINRTLMYQYGLDRAMHTYLDTLITGIDLIPADFLCHLDVIWRNYPEIETNSEIEAKFQNILKKVKRHNMALEINTSGFEHRGEQYPGNILLSRARALEIPFVVGSDSHTPEQVGRHFEKVQAWFE